MTSHYRMLSLNLAASFAPLGRPLLMCREASVRDPEIAALCEGIMRSQQQEIDRMKRCSIGSETMTR